MKLDNNKIKDYYQHDIERVKLNETDQGLLERIQAERKSSTTDVVRASLYKLNPGAIAIIAVYVLYFFWFKASILLQSLGFAGSIVFGAILIFVPIYVQNTHNPKYKMKIPDKGVLVFSSRGVDCKQLFCPIADIESAVVYLESFNGFVYRDRTTTGNAKTKMYGDNNKISFRNKGEVTDFTFILDSAKDYWTFKNLMAGWSARGINVVMQKVFEDEYIMQEMVHFHNNP